MLLVEYFPSGLPGKMSILKKKRSCFSWFFTATIILQKSTCQANLTPASACHSAKPHPCLTKDQIIKFNNGRSDCEKKIIFSWRATIYAPDGLRNQVRKSDANPYTLLTLINLTRSPDQMIKNYPGINRVWARNAAQQSHRHRRSILQISNFAFFQARQKWINQCQLRLD